MTIFVTDAEDRTILDYDGTSGALKAWTAYGLGSNAVLAEMDVAAGTRETLIPDVQGSIVGLLDSGTGTLTKIGYESYGEHPGLNPGGYRYTAQRFDPETSGSAAEPSGLYDYRARIYSPTLGRFLQPDPAGYAAGTNLYAYTGNDPINLTDPSGLWQVTVSAGLGFGGALTLGYNSGQWNIGAYVGPAIGANLSVNPANAAAKRPGVYTGFVGSAGAEVGPIAVDVGGGAQTTAPQGRVVNYGVVSVDASANFGAYSAGSAY